MSKLTELFKLLFDKFLKFFVDKSTGEIFVKAAFVAAVLVFIAGIYAAYTLALIEVSVALPSQFDWALQFIPANTPTVLTAVTTLRVALFIASLKMGLASVQVSK